MLCSEFDARLQHLLDQRFPPERDAELASHCQQCSECQGRLDKTVTLLDALELIELPPLPHDFAQRVVDSVVLPQPAPRRFMSKWIAVAASVSAAALLLLALLPVVWYTQSPTPVSKAAEPRSETRQVPGPSEKEAIVFAPSRNGWMDSTTLLQLYTQETRERHLQQVNQTLNDLRPIATPFSAAVTAIRRSLPVGRTQTERDPSASVDRTATTLASA